MSELLFGTSMQACAGARDAERYRSASFGYDSSFVPESFSFAFTDAERDQAATACGAWLTALETAALPACADQADLDADAADTVDLIAALDVLQVGYGHDAAARRRLVEGLLVVAEAALALARGDSSGLVVPIVGRAAATVDAWWAVDAAPALQRRKRRLALAEGFPSAAHRFAVRLSVLEKTDPATSPQAATLDPAMRALFTEAVENVVDALRGVDCAGGWDACVQGIGAVEDELEASMDPTATAAVMARPPGTDLSTLSTAERAAVRIQTGLTVVRAIRYELERDAETLEALQGSAD